MNGVDGDEKPGRPVVTRRQALGATLGLVSVTGGCLGPTSRGPAEATQTPSSITTGSPSTRTITGTSTISDRLPPPVRGDPEADVTVAAYVDFACPHCREYELETVPKLLENYVEPGSIRYEHRDFPVPVDVTESWSAANAARAVQERDGDDAFWSFAHRLFEAQYSLSPGFYEEVAADLGLDGEAVRRAAVERTYQATVEADKRRGKQRQVYSTPTVVVDGSPVASDSYALLERVIEAKLSE